MNFLEKNENKDNAINDKIKGTSQEILDLKNKYPNIPDEFLEYLSEIGSGNIMQSQFKIMNKLFDFKDLVLEDIYDLPENIKLFGDN